MKRKRRYTYVPKEEIAEIRTFNDVSFESDDLLDGAYVKGRKKFARGGVPKRALSLEEQAAEAVGYDVWYKMESNDQNELIAELVSSGMIAPMMAHGGEIDIQDGDDVKMAFKKKTVLEIYESDDSELDNPVEEIFNEGEVFEVTIFGIDKQKYDVQFGDGSVAFIRKADVNVIDVMADGGMMAKGGEVVSVFMLKQAFEAGGKNGSKAAMGKDFESYTDWLSTSSLMDSKNKLKPHKLYEKAFIDGGKSAYNMIKGRDYQSFEEWKDENYRDYADGGVTDTTKVVTVGEDTWYLTYIDSTHFYLSNSPDSKGMVFHIGEFRGKEPQWLWNDVRSWLKSNPKMMADGGVTGTTYVVKYSMKDTPEVVKEKVFADKDSAELFHETISDDEDLVVMDLQEVKAAPAPKPKKSLFESAKPVPATTAAAKKKRERVQVDGIADQIARYDQLKATINNAKAEQEVIGGMLKEIGRDKFLEIYEERGVRPANFDLADGNENILLEVTDKYLKVEPEKAELLRQFDGLLEEKTTYEFDSDILEKEVSDGMTVGDVVSMLIQESKLIPESDKPNLIKAKKTMRVPKGTIDRLMEYDNPREVFSLISPILALK